MNEKFSDAAKSTLNWVEGYFSEIEDYPVLSQVAPNDILNKLPISAPDESVSYDEILKDFKDVIVPGITHWQHPKFFGYFPANSSPPSVLAEMLIASLGVQGMSWITSPAATELEIRMMEWLRDMFKLSSEFTGVIQDSASSSTMIAMITAREKITKFRINEEGYLNNNLVAYCSEEAHSSVEKAAKIIGLGRSNLRKIPVDEFQSMKTSVLEETILEDIRNGKVPFFVVGAFGTTGTTGVDSLSEISKISKKYGLWHHVDAAYAGAALILPEVRKLAKGIDDADSIVINPHKWLLTTFDCSAFFIKDTGALTDSFSICPEYLKTSEEEPVVNFRDWGLGLGRRFRSLKLWFVLRWYGVKGIQSILRSHIELASLLQSLIEEDSRFELLPHRHFNLVCFRLKSSNEKNMDLLNRVNSSGKLFISHTKVKEQIYLRFVTGQTNVNETHVNDAWTVIGKMVC